MKLLKLIRSKLPKDKTLSIAAPASYWYLKQFPIKSMSELLDYIVFMTYDLHGQWDSGNEWASPGCPTGNCLRSHVNQTETMGSLAMITKAGVPSNKVLVGVSSYGRSFQMADPSCTGPNCLFTGDGTTSNARKGRCTKTGGYLANAELNEILGSVARRQDGDSKTWLDKDSNSRIMVDGDLWVSYMDNDLKNSRAELYEGHNMGGTIDWAVDLVKFRDPPSYGVDDGVDLGLDWATVKKQIKAGDDAEKIGCDGAMLTRTGDWVSKECNIDEVAEPSAFTPSQRWEALECQNAWEDAIRVWKACRGEKESDYTFSKAIAEFLHVIPGSVSGNSSSDEKGAETKHDRPPAGLRRSVDRERLRRT